MKIFIKNYRHSRIEGPIENNFLSKAEYKYALLLKDQLSYKEISEKLNRSIRSVEDAVYKLKDKFNLKDVRTLQSYLKLIL
ncbi:hypothetical protein BGC07_15135 [Piscirickettsia litoralis]|uniref:HTH luxR-type domain-containing protein n=1 Tax=Piscirickettsia litoralis TaxID=1891921 RepID=A0ABX2ZYJ4_9GAMM|nr:hypothetical protein BGC07_15135 [Piscirickettsia litoralis]